MFDTTRYQIASWLSPELADYRKRYANAQAEVETYVAIQKASATAYDSLTRRCGDINDRLIQAGLKLNSLKTALWAAQNYVIDALDDALVAADKATVKKRTEAEIVVVAIKTDLEAIAEALK